MGLGVVGQWYAIANPHLGSGSKRIRNSGSSLATERVQIQFGMHESLPQNKTGFLKEEHWAVGAVQEVPCKGECLPSSQGIIFNPVDRQLKIPILT